MQWTYLQLLHIILGSILPVQTLVQELHSKGPQTYYSPKLRATRRQMGCARTANSCACVLQTA